MTETSVKASRTLGDDLTVLHEYMKQQKKAVPGLISLLQHGYAP